MITGSPKKRTALGRFAHEGAWPARVVAGEPLVWYMGCDSRGEYIYKYVSNKPWDPADAGKGMAAGDKYLDDGKLYAARFNADGSGMPGLYLVLYLIIVTKFSDMGAYIRLYTFLSQIFDFGNTATEKRAMLSLELEGIETEVVEVILDAPEASFTELTLEEV